MNEVKKPEDITPFLMENPDIVTMITAFCDTLTEYKTVNTKIIQRILNCSEAEAREFVRHLERCEMVEKLDITDAYFVIKDALEGIVFLLKIQREAFDVKNKLN